MQSSGPTWISSRGPRGRRSAARQRTLECKKNRTGAGQQLPIPHLRELLEAFREAVLRAEMFTRHHIAREPLSVRERMTRILARVSASGGAGFVDLVDPAEGRMGVVVCLLAVLELVKGSMVELEQEGPFTPLTIQVARAREAVMETQGE